jgi:hypothetical protein
MGKLAPKKPLLPRFVWMLPQKDGKEFVLNLNAPFPGMAKGGQIRLSIQRQ